MAPASEPGGRSPGARTEQGSEAPGARTSLDVRVLRATDPSYIRSVERVAALAGCSQELALSALRRLRGRMLVEVDGSRPARWLRTRDGDVALEHEPTQVRGACPPRG